MKNPLASAVVLAALLLGSSWVQADEAGPCASEGHRQFDFWIGAWSIDNLQASPASPDDPTLHASGRANNIVYPVAGGCAIVEHWEGLLTWGRVHGFSLRAYDPERQAWTIVLNWPVPGSPGPRFNTMDGAFRHRRGSFYSPRDRPRVARFDFSDIGPDSLRWDQSVSTDGEKTWATQWVMEMSRLRADREPPAFTGVTPLGAGRTLRCSDPKDRALDAMVGTWTGRDAAGASASVRVLPILDGCALMAFVDAGDRHEFQVRAVDPGGESWVEYRIDSRDGRLLRGEGTLASQALDVVAADGVKDRWAQQGDTLTWSRTRDGGTTTIELARR